MQQLILPTKRPEPVINRRAATKRGPIKPTQVHTLHLARRSHKACHIRLAKARRRHPLFLVAQWPDNCPTKTITHPIRPTMPTITWLPARTRSATVGSLLVWLATIQPHLMGPIIINSSITITTKVVDRHLYPACRMATQRTSTNEVPCR